MKFTGFLKYDALSDIYAQSDAFRVAGAARDQSWPNSLKPVVAESWPAACSTVSRVGGLPEVVGGRRN